MFIFICLTVKRASARLTFIDSITSRCSGKERAFPVIIIYSRRTVTVVSTVAGHLHTGNIVLGGNVCR